ncbi:MAG: hypothetical protein PF693_12155, partial [Spirochaetia bacterium]|nr:hypothetical protein [Spirochaetia bacterium]
MDPIIERFNRLLKSMMVDTNDIDFGNDDFSGSVNNDYEEAWDELNDFLSSPKYESKTSFIPSPPEILREDYKN